MKGWTAEITNNPDNDYELYMELLEDDEYRARIERAPSAQLVLTVYGTTQAFSLPIDWLLEVVEGFKKATHPSLRGG